jgi:hypothetical protein
VRLLGLLLLNWLLLNWLLLLLLWRPAAAAIRLAEIDPDPPVVDNHRVHLSILKKKL